MRMRTLKLISDFGLSALLEQLRDVGFSTGRVAPPAYICGAGGLRGRAMKGHGGYLVLWSDLIRTFFWLEKLCFGSRSR
jgi:hypothetical protein